MDFSTDDSKASKTFHLFLMGKCTKNTKTVLRHEKGQIIWRLTEIGPGEKRR